MARILVVENHSVMRPMIRDLLQLEGYAVVTAADGVEALEALEKIAIDLVLTDYLLLEMNGLVLLQTLRADSRYTELPVVFFTATANPEICERAMVAGANDFLLRPITPQDLLDAVRKSLLVHQET